MANQKTKIYLIGVIHSENQNRNSDSLLNLLKNIKPDLILAETDSLSGYFKPDFTLVQPPQWYRQARKLNMGRKMPPEMGVLYDYKKTDSAVAILPFDITIKNRNKSVSKNNADEVKWLDNLNKANLNGEIPLQLQNLHEKVEHYTNYFVDLLPKSYRDINRTVVSDSIRQLFMLENEYFPKVIEIVPKLKAFKNWYSEHSAYWQLRNKTMYNNILKMIEMKKAKRVVVFTGLLHKYYLSDLLNEEKGKYNFELAEYYQPDF